MIASNQSFKDMTICLDGSTFVGCMFKRCRLTFSGIPAVNLEKNKFTRCIWEFTGPTQNIVGFMTQFYAGGAKELIGNTFTSIHEGAISARRSGDPKVSN